MKNINLIPVDRFIAMKDINQTIQKVTEELKRERDEIQLKLHLGKEELEDEWEELEKKLAHLESKVKEIEKTASAAAEDVLAAAKLLSDELRRGYKKIRKKL